MVEGNGAQENLLHKPYPDSAYVFLPRTLLLSDRRVV